MGIERISTANDDDIILSLSGTIDETQAFPILKARLSQRLIFECKKLSHMNSFGIQSWIKWMRQFDPRQQFVFRNVPPRVIDHFNLVEGFLPAESTIESFYVPYQCDSCDYEENVLARRGHEFLEASGSRQVKLLLPAEMNCPKCKSGMKLGIWESKYLRFLNERE